MWDLKTIDVSKPLYLAIVDALERDVRAGVLRAGDILPTHRDLAKTVGVTISTVTRAYAEASKRNLIMAIVGKGTFVASDAGVRPSLVNAAGREKTLIEMGLVHPLFSEERHLEKVIGAVLARGNLHKYVVYSQPQGVPAHRQTGAEWVRRFGVEATKEGIVVTAGTQHALSCIFSALFEPGDRLAVECLTYPGMKSAARRSGLRLEAVDMDESGILPASLEALCHRHEIRGVCATGNMHNPTNWNMTDQRRKDIAAIIKKRNLLLVEDDIYGFLAPHSAPITALVRENGIYIAGLAKAFYSGLRTAFVAAPPSLCGKITQSVVDSIWMASPLCAEIACEAIRSGFADKVIERKKRELARRTVLFKEAMRGFSYHLAEPNMFAWLKLPKPWTSAAFEQAAREGGIRVMGSERFTVGHSVPPDYVRVSLSAARNIRQFGTGLDILVRVLRSEAPPAAGRRDRKSQTAAERQ